MEEKTWDLKSETCELNSVPEFSYVLREVGEAQRKAKVVIDRVMRGEVKPVAQEVVKAALVA